MNEHRRPVEVWIRRLPKITGKKVCKNCTLKIELFPIYLWASHWEPASPLFSPKLPLKSGTRKEYWETRYRIRVNGKWESRKAKYVGYTKKQIRERYFQ